MIGTTLQAQKAVVMKFSDLRNFNNGNRAKAEGTYYEWLFMTECLNRGLHPHDTVGDYLPHDLIVMNDGGKLFKGQVKGTRHGRIQGGRQRFEVTIGRGREKYRTDEHMVDIYAFHVYKHNQWYIMPFKSVNTATVRFYPETIGKTKSYTQKYLDNWDCFNA